jgi:hypothetical protein
VGNPATGRLLNDEGLVGISTVEEPGTAPVPAYLGQVITYSAGLDLALVELRMRLDGTALPDYRFFPALPLPGLRDRPPTVGEPLSAYGFAAGYSQPLSGVPGTLQDYALVSGYGGRPMVISTTAAYGPGLSGGAVLNASGRFVGMALGMSGRGTDARGVARSWEEIRSWATGQLTATQNTAPVVVTGQIVDHDTRRGIARAVFLILKPHVDSEDFLADPTDADVAARAGTGRDGIFVTHPPVAYGFEYNMVVYAEGYSVAFTTRPILLDDRTCPGRPRCEFGTIELERLRR